MKKRLLTIFLFILLLTNFLITNLILAQTPALPGLTGELDDSGLPKEFSDFKDNAEKLSKEEEREKYLQQEWTKLMADKKIVGPFLFYTNKIFIFFNPFWKIIFGIEFSWSWKFVFIFMIWLFIIGISYITIKSTTKINSLYNLISSIIIASIIGVTQIISKLVFLLNDFITNIWLALVSIILTFLIYLIFRKLIEKYLTNMKEEIDELELESNKEKIKEFANLTENITK